MLTDEQIQAWRSDGYVAVEGFLTPAEVAGLVGDASAMFPTREEFEEIKRNPESLGFTNLLDQGKVAPSTSTGLAFAMLPYPGRTLNTLAFHPRVIEAAEQLLATNDIRLTQSIARATYCGPDTYFSPDKIDQLLHRDHDDNMLVSSPRDAHDQLAVLIYLTDVGLGEAPTHVVSKRHSDHLPYAPNRKTRERDADLYAHEVPVTGPAGTALFYTLRTWHRGSEGRNPEGFRVVHHAVYRRAGVDWINFTAWPSRFASDDGHRLVEGLDPRQRELLGIPAAGDPYWTAETVEDFAERYPAADTTPYLV